MRSIHTLLLPFLFAPLAAQQAPTALARQILKEMIGTDTTGEHGDTTPLVESLAKRFREAGVPAADVQVVGPEARHRNLVVRLRGASIVHDADARHRNRVVARRIEPREKPILVISHLDVVEAKREDWTKDPFKLTEDGGYYYGRGTQDIKGEAAAEAAVFLQLAKEGFKPKRDLILALTTGEEGSTFYNGIEWLLANRRDLIDAEFCLNGDGGAVNAHKGVARYRTLQTAEKGFYMIDLEVTDPGGHSSMPRPGNPIQVLGAALGKLEAFRLPVSLDESRRAYFAAMGRVEGGPIGTAMEALAKDASDAAAEAFLVKADPTYNALMRTTVTATLLQGGHASNALPQSAKASLNVRLLPGDDVLEVRARLVAAIADPRVKVALREKPAPNPASPLRKDLMDALNRTTARLWPGLPVIPAMDAGTTDGVFLRLAGIPTYGISGIPQDLDDFRAHGQDERIRVKDFDLGVEAFDLLLRDLGK